MANHFCVTEWKRTRFEREGNKFSIWYLVACKVYKNVQVGVSKATGSKYPELHMNIC